MSVESAHEASRWESAMSGFSPRVRLGLLAVLGANLILGLVLLVINFQRTKAGVQDLFQMRAESERQLIRASNLLENLESRRAQLEKDNAAAQARMDQLQRQTEETRQARERADAEWTQEVKGRQAALERENQEQARARVQTSRSLADTQKLLAQTQTAQEKAVREQSRLAGQVADLKKQLEEMRQDASELEIRRVAAKTELEKTEAHTAAAHKLSQEFTLRQHALVREVSRLEAAVERLKQEKAGLEKTQSSGNEPAETHGELASQAAGTPAAK